VPKLPQKTTANAASFLFLGGVLSLTGIKINHVGFKKISKRPYAANIHLVSPHNPGNGKKQRKSGPKSITIFKPINIL